MVDHVPASELLRAELARRAGCHLESVRYYEKIGMLPEPPRTAAGYRVYGAGHLARLRSSRQVAAEVNGYIVRISRHRAVWRSRWRASFPAGPKGRLVLTES